MIENTIKYQRISDIFAVNQWILVEAAPGKTFIWDQ